MILFKEKRVYCLNANSRRYIIFYLLPDWSSTSMPLTSNEWVPNYLSSGRLSGMIGYIP